MEKELGVAMLLREGHDAIFEMTFDGEVIYTNESVCGRFPTAERVLDLAELYTGRPRRDPSGLLEAGSQPEASGRPGAGTGVAGVPDACCPE